MPRALDPVVAETLKKYGFGKDAVWDCHGVWVVYHRVLEQIAAQAGVRFDPPTILEANGLERLAAICVTGRVNDKAEWSIGEASPHNYKTSGKQQPYPWAMAEKRAKDRVILKLIGLHGFVYSEEEADDFKEQKTTPVPDVVENGRRLRPSDGWHGPLKITELKDKMRALKGELEAASDADSLNIVVQQYQTVLEQCAVDLPDWYFGNGDAKGAQARIAERTFELNKDHQSLTAA